MLCESKKVLQDGEQSAVYPADRNPMPVIRTSREGTLQMIKILKPATFMQ